MPGRRRSSFLPSILPSVLPSVRPQTIPGRKGRKPGLSKSADHKKNSAENERENKSGIKQLKPKSRQKAGKRNKKQRGVSEQQPSVPTVLDAMSVVGAEPEENDERAQQERAQQMEYEEQLGRLRDAVLRPTSIAAQQALHDRTPEHTVWNGRVGLATLPSATKTSEPTALAQSTESHDFALATHPFGGSEERLLVGVYSGHGKEAGVLARYAALSHVSVLESEVLARAEANSGLVADLERITCLTASFGRLDQTVQQCCPRLHHQAGCTAIVAYIDRSQVFIGCLGDARCVKGSFKAERSQWKASGWTDDQTPSLHSEKVRIEASGGRVLVERLSSEEGGQQKTGKPEQHAGRSSRHRVLLADEALDPAGLHVSRSLGDTPYKSVGVTADPVVDGLELSADDDTCLVLAGSGVWEYLTNEEVVALCKTHEADATSAARAIVLEARDRWHADTGVDQQCDLTAAVVMLRAPPVDVRGNVIPRLEVPDSSRASSFTMLGSMFAEPPKTDPTRGSPNPTRLPDHDVPVRRGSSLW